MSDTPTFKGIHHLKFPVRDIHESLGWYQRVFGADHDAKLDHKDPQGELYAVILDVPNLGTRLELRHDPENAAKQAGFDPVTLAVEGRAALEAWSNHLDAAAVEHSAVLTGALGWLIVLEDPDKRRLRFYTLEQHPEEKNPSTDLRWLDSPKPE